MLPKNLTFLTPFVPCLASSQLRLTPRLDCMELYVHTCKVVRCAVLNLSSTYRSTQELLPTQPDKDGLKNYNLHSKIDNALLHVWDIIYTHNFCGLIFSIYRQVYGKFAYNESVLTLTKSDCISQKQLNGTSDNYILFFDFLIINIYHQTCLVEHRK